MFWTESKIQSRLAELSHFRYRNRINIPTFRFQLDEAGEVGSKPPEGGAWRTIEVGERWVGNDVYAWLEAEVTIPKVWADETVLGYFDFGQTGGGNNSGFESLLYVNGIPYQGVDSNHQEVFLPDHIAGTSVLLQIRLWSGLDDRSGIPQILEHTIAQADIACLDEPSDDLYFTAKAVIDTVAVLNEHDPARLALMQSVDRAFKVIDWSRPGSEQFYISVQEARALLHDELAKLDKHHAVTVHCIGHTHIDVAWLWRLKHTREKSARSFSTVLRLMERYPDYVFLQTQPQLYAYLKEDYPEIYAQIKARITEGRWETEGAMWLEADCNIPSGESLVRQLLFGKQFLKKEFGITSEYLWLPDVFGYSWALPQILAKSGIKTFMTTKISWNQYNRMPFDTFYWRGIDGSEVLTHFITTPEAGQTKYTYNGTISAQSVTGIWHTYRDKSFNQDLLLAYGYGDGGGGVNREMLEMRRRLDQLPGIPHVKIGRADHFFAQLHERVRQTDQYVHTWDGELYLEYHRGTYTSQAYNKRMNRKLELLYRETEWLQTLDSVLAMDWTSYEQASLAKGWTIILRNQFHDIIPGSSIRQVYDDSKLEYEAAEQLGDELWQKSAANLMADSQHSGDEGIVFTVFNSSSWPRTDVVEISSEVGMEQGFWLDEQGAPLLAQSSEDQTKWLVHIKDIPSLGFTTIRFVPHKEKEVSDNDVPFVKNESGIRTPLYDISWNEHGQLVAVILRESGRNLLQGQGNVFQVFEDKPLNYDAWDIDAFYQEKMREVTALRSIQVKEMGPLQAVIAFVWDYMDSSIEQEMVLYAMNHRIDFRTTVQWHEQRQLLKVAFPVDVRAVEATYDIQFGNVKRPTHWNTSWDFARFESVGHQWADLSERGFGVSLLNDCKYGYDIKDNVMRLSLIKSAISPDAMQDQGEHQFTYALFAHEGDWYAGETAQQAWFLNHPLTVARGFNDHKSLSLFRFSVDHVMVDAIKKAEEENKLLIRLHEFAGQRGTVAVTSDLNILKWQACNLMEEPLAGESHETPFRFDIKPYEILTFKVDLA